MRAKHLSWDSPKVAKQRMATELAWGLLAEMAAEMGVSESEMLERMIRTSYEFWHESMSFSFKDAVLELIKDSE